MGKRRKKRAAAKKIVPKRFNWLQDIKVVAKYEPQATAVELAQLGEGDSPRCGEMSRRDKGAGHPLNRGQAAPCKEWTIGSNQNLGEIDKCCSSS